MPGWAAAVRVAARRAEPAERAAATRVAGEAWLAAADLVAETRTAADPPAAAASSDASGGDGGTLIDAGAITADAFYVATNGSDNNPGTFAQPFATLGKAQTAMQASATKKTTYVRGGTYKPATTGGNCLWGDASGSSIGLSSADDGETWSYYPPDGYGSGILDGQSTTGNSGGTTGNGTGCGFGASQVKNVT